MNFMNSSNRLPDGAGMQNPRTGNDLSDACSAATRLKVISKRQSPAFKADIRVMSDISAGRRYFVDREINEPHEISKVS